MELVVCSIVHISGFIEVICHVQIVTISFDCAALKRQNPALQGFSGGSPLFGLDFCIYTGRSSYSWNIKPTIVHFCLESRIERMVTTTI